MTFITGIFGNIKNFFVFIGGLFVGLYILFLKNESKNAKEELENHKDEVQKESVKNTEKSFKEEIKVKEIEHESKVETIKDVRDIEREVDNEIKNISKLFGNDSDLVIKI